jgi:hypothetical protein
MAARAATRPVASAGAAEDSAGSTSHQTSTRSGHLLTAAGAP